MKNGHMRMCPPKEVALKREAVSIKRCTLSLITSSGISVTRNKYICIAWCTRSAIFEMMYVCSGSLFKEYRNTMSVGDMLDKLLVAEISETSGAAYRVILKAKSVFTPPKM